MSGFKDCKKKIIDSTMKEYEEKKLKVSGKRIVKDRKQAIAIALNYAENNCKYTSNDYELIKEKVNQFLYNDDRKISKSRVPLTNVIETKVLIQYYLKKKNTKKAKQLKDDLLKRIISAGKDGIKISKNIFSELNEIY